jgi:hypothetical protein
VPSTQETNRNGSQGEVLGLGNLPVDRTPSAHHRNNFRTRCGSFRYARRTPAQLPRDRGGHSLQWLAQTHASQFPSPTRGGTYRGLFARCYHCIPQARPEIVPILHLALAIGIHQHLPDTTGQSKSTRHASDRTTTGSSTQNHQREVRHKNANPVGEFQVKACVFGQSGIW